jgi:hypothetical protein
MILMRKLILMLLSLGILSCFSLEAMRWGEWIAPDVTGLRAESVANFDWSEWPGMIISIDGNRSPGTGHKKAKLLPGRHVFEYSNYLAEFGPGNHVTGTIEIELKAGHSYMFGFDTCYWCKPRRFAVWVDDQTTGEVVWGKGRDWPFWFL